MSSYSHLAVVFPPPSSTSVKLRSCFASQFNPRHFPTQLSGFRTKIEIVAATKVSPWLRTPRQHVDWAASPLPRSLSTFTTRWSRWWRGLDRCILCCNMISGWRPHAQPIFYKGGVEVIGMAEAQNKNGRPF